MLRPVLDSLFLHQTRNVLSLLKGDDAWRRPGRISNLAGPDHKPQAAGSITLIIQRTDQPQ